ncbi:hypothetical protein PP427_gp175 [Salmonella phage KM16]|nr:hypothetical protein PP427_gp175 [Salmonella phage KM16]
MPCVYQFHHRCLVTPSGLEPETYQL